MRPESAGGAWIKLKLRQGQEIRYRPIDRTAQLSKLPISGQVGNTKVQMKSSPLGFQSVKVIALAATDVVRAKRFYSETLQLLYYR
jgi:hypothetical protein